MVVFGEVKKRVLLGLKEERERVCSWGRREESVSVEGVAIVFFFSFGEQKMLSISRSPYMYLSLLYP